MIIRCPHCEHSRSISEGKIPPTAELATCPKCKHRFRFRTLPRTLPEEETPVAAPESGPAKGASRSAPAQQRAPDGPVQEVIRPQEAFRESAEQNDIWDAVDALHQRWEKQLEQHVVDVEHPGLDHMNLELSNSENPDSEHPAPDAPAPKRSALDDPEAKRPGYSEPGGAKPHQPDHAHRAPGHTVPGQTASAASGHTASGHTAPGPAESGQGNFDQAKQGLAQAASQQTQPPQTQPPQTQPPLAQPLQAQPPQQQPPQQQAQPLQQQPPLAQAAPQQSSPVFAAQALPDKALSQPQANLLPGLAAGGQPLPSAPEAAHKQAAPQTAPQPLPVQTPTPLPTPRAAPLSGQCPPLGAGIAPQASPQAAAPASVAAPGPAKQAVPGVLGQPAAPTLSQSSAATVPPADATHSAGAAHSAATHSADAAHGAPPQDELPPKPRIRVRNILDEEGENYEAAFAAPATSLAPSPAASPAMAEPLVASASSALSAAPAFAAQVARPRFLYGEDGPAPEERVAKDMEMLRGGGEARPTRDLGCLREFSESAAETGADTGAETEAPNTLHLPLPEEQTAFRQSVAGVPWEKPGKGRFSAFNATIRAVMLDAPNFFKNISGSGSLAPGYLFFLFMGYLGIFCSLAWCWAAERLLPGLLPPFPQGIVLPALLLLAPAALGLMQLFVTGWIRLSLRLVAPDKADFGLVFKIVSYSVAPFVLSLVPFAGPLLGAAWFMAALVAGCRGALRLSPALSVLLPLPPAVLLMAGIVFFFF